MMKIVMVMLFMNLMMLKNKFYMFYYNLNFLLMFLVLGMYMFKDFSLSILLGMSLGMNYYSFWLIVLSIFIISLIMMCVDNNKNNSWCMLVMFMVLSVILMLFFMFMDLLYFYMVYEISIIPIFFLVIYWGNNLERLSASYYLMMYMLLVSFPLLLYIFKMFFFSNSLKFNLLEFYMLKYNLYFMEMVIIYGAFMVKLPVYLVHMWLPKAHVEASVEGSMILAGVLLKMGGYGMIRFMYVFLKYTVKFNYLFMSVGLVGSLMISVLCISQIDMKMLIAYSSVVHMNMMLVSMMTLYKLAILSGLIIMFSHGMCSSGLFYMVNMYYKMSGSRLLILNKGMVGSMSFLTMWWFLLCSSNFSFPFSLNFVGEVLMLGVIMNWDLLFMVYMMIICFFCSVYNLYLYIYMQHGGNFWVSKKMNNMVKEFLVLIMHFFPLNLLLFNLGLFM